MSRQRSAAGQRNRGTRGGEILHSWPVDRTNDYGTVERGKIADLVLLDADPTRTVNTLHRIDQIVLHGKLLNRAAIRVLLQKAQTDAERS